MTNTINALYLKVAEDYDDGRLGSIWYGMKKIHAAPDYHSQLQDMYNLIHCETVEHFSICTHKGNVFDVWLDEEGKLVSPKKFPCIPLMYNKELRDIIVGNCIITKSNPEGDIEEITEEDVNEFLEFLKLSWRDACNGLDILDLQKLS